jgi:RHS repeat-associated protein
MEYGNGVSTQWTYDDAPAPLPATGVPTGAFGAGTLRTAAVENRAGTLLSNRVYDWDAVGNLTHVTDSAGGAGGVGRYEATFAYDDLGRLSTASLALPQQSPLDLSYAYDPIGNLTLIDGASLQGDLRLEDGARQSYGRTVSATCAGAPSPLPHAVTARTVLTALPATTTVDPRCYDAAGRLLRSVDSVRNSIATYHYFARGKVRSIVDRDGESRYLYDGDGERVSKVEPDGETQLMVGPSYREMFQAGVPARSAAFEAIYSSAGTPVARRVLSRANAAQPVTTGPTDLNWFVLDSLGGTLFVTNAQGQEVAGSRAFYRPYGGFVNRAQPPAGDASGHRQFTGKELDSTGLYDFGARLYDPLTGQFTQPDNAELGLGPQAQDRYSYTLDNPLRYVDVNGNWPTDTHNNIIDRAFPGLTDHQRGVLKQRSLDIDGLEGQKVAHNHEHAMRGPDEDPGVAAAGAEAYIQDRLVAARTAQASDGGVVHARDLTDAALQRYTEAFHAISDRESPAHTGPDGGPLVWNGWSEFPATDHKNAEATITPEQMTRTVNLVRDAFRTAFGPEVYYEATGIAPQPANLGVAPSGTPEMVTRVPEKQGWEPDWGATPAPQVQLGPYNPAQHPAKPTRPSTWYPLPQAKYGLEELEDPGP